MCRTLPLFLTKHPDRSVAGRDSSRLRFAPTPCYEVTIVQRSGHSSTLSSRGARSDRVEPSGSGGSVTGAITRAPVTGVAFGGTPPPPCQRWGARWWGFGTTSHFIWSEWTSGSRPGAKEAGRLLASWSIGGSGCGGQRTPSCFQESSPTASSVASNS